MRNPVVAQAAVAAMDLMTMFGVARQAAVEHVASVNEVQATAVEAELELQANHVAVAYAFGALDYERAMTTLHNMGEPEDRARLRLLAPAGSC